MGYDNEFYAQADRFKKMIHEICVAAYPNGTTREELQRSFGPVEYQLQHEQLVYLDDQHTRFYAVPNKEEVVYAQKVLAIVAELNK